MCVTCGCLEPAASHGAAGNITLKRLRKAAAAAGLPVTEAAWNVPRTILAAAHGPAGDVLATHPALIFDCDGILAFTAEALCCALNSRFGAAYSPVSQRFFPGCLISSRLPGEQAAWAAGLLREPSFLATLAPDFHALDTLTDAYDAGYDCRIVTERDPATAAVTEDWLDEWGAPAVPVSAVGHGGKPAALTPRYGVAHPAVLIDDNPAAKLAVARPGIQVWAPLRADVPTTAREHVRDFAGWAQVRHWLGLSPAPWR